MENSGKPIVVSPRCAEEDLKWTGLACSPDEPCSLYLEVSAVESVGSRIFAAGNIHSSAVTLYSELLASDDAGRTWREAYERIPGAGLDRVEFIDSEIGWAVGQILFPLPQDPFLLATADGGKTWRRQPVFGEERPGSIVEFGFINKTRGSLVFDRGPTGGRARYESYESQDGGASWTLRDATSAPPRAKTGPPPLLRLRVDGPTQSFQIERRAGDRWTEVASFAVKLGACENPDPPNPR
jgi:hypothetical protein